MGSRFSIVIEPSGTAAIAGPIDETASFAAIVPGKSLLKLDFSEVSSINSLGVAAFIQFVETWAGRPVEYHNLPIVLADAMQMLPVLLGPEENTARVASLRWPVDCERGCKRLIRELSASEISIADGQVTLTAACAKCSGRLILTGEPESLVSLYEAGALHPGGAPSPVAPTTSTAPAAEAPTSLGAKLKASRQTLTIMFIDVAGFSLLAEDRSPNDLFQELKPFIGQMRKTIRAHGGIVDKVLGDGILAYFGFDQPVTAHRDHATAALDCAAVLQTEALARCLSAKAVGGAQYPIRIGLNSAQVYVGDLGDDDKVEFTVIGHGVNYAKRIEDSCDIFMVMMSEATKEMIERTQRRPGFLKRHINIKHHDRLFEVYEFNPFVSDQQSLNEARKGFQEFQGLFRQEQRRVLKADVPLAVACDYGSCRIVDFSTGGLQVVIDKYLARGVNIRLQIQARGDDRKAQYLNLIGLSSLNCIVRWGTPSADGRGFVHGLKILNVNEEQRRIFMTMLASYAVDPTRS